MMRSFVSTLLFAVFVARVHALPTELHTLGRRDNVCALNLRGATAKDCLVDNKGTFFTLTPPSTITATAVTCKPFNQNVYHHIVELQLLDGALQKTGVCTMITAMIKAQSSVSKAALLQPLSDVINGNKNLNFLASTVNNRKKTVVGNSLKGKGKAAGNDDLNVAVGNYLQLTKASSTDIAKSLDVAVAKIIEQAQTIANALPADSGTGRKKVTTKSDLEKAIATANKSKNPVSTAWQAVLDDAPHA
ncbi:hypothetical protein HETIRDRAFT_120415 [Heterobasidion irregulare TC 32-1]|uniref:Uncharacterized protein n=1 Tax=Heterobasidion irregulare (strain TC 32-1) TaxID=747525 RepID=W4JNH6_HETIT|nr:uncharacterized protein HETIRDRAFT_120415 [Heterobasidion irregulare TC 32-1]ETW75112.1 hypothetical protein HETIRDRAFT_120415 [Heterobasidion irregulare TC 32-1]